MGQIGKKTVVIATEEPAFGLRDLEDRSMHRNTEVGALYQLACALTEHAEWLIEQGREDEVDPLVAEAHEIFDRLQARPGLERLARLGEPETAAQGS